MSARNMTAYRVRAGSFERLYATDYHAEQMARALRLHGMDVTVDAVRLPNDPLSRLVTGSHAHATLSAGPL